MPTVRPCRTCGAAGPFYRTNRTECKDCVRLRNRRNRHKKPDQYKATYTAWRLANPEKRRASNAAWVGRNKAKASACVRRCHERAPEKGRQRAREWYRRHRLLALARQKANHLARPEVYRAIAKRWNEKHVERVREFCRNRRARLMSATSTLTHEQWAEILECFGWACAYCLRSDRPLTLDHIIALVRGGTHSSDNVVPACRSCNSKKGARPVWVMLQI